MNRDRKSVISKMPVIKLTSQGVKLIKQYEIMAAEGFLRTDGTHVPPGSAYNSFQLGKFRHICKPYFDKNVISTVLDYGGGGSDWDASNFNKEDGKSAKQFFNVQTALTFEPARGLNKKNKSDAVVCIDVLEHIFLGDVPKILNDLFGLARKLLVINVACYKAAALLPSGENAHITVRPPEWWKGAVDMVSANHPDVEILLICSTSFDQGVIYESHRFTDWLLSESFEVSGQFSKFSMSK